MTKIKSIINGWKNYAFPSDEVESIAKERAKICENCKYAKEMIVEVFTKDFTLENVNKLACSKCLCPLSTKLRSEEEKCPLNKW